MSSAPVHLYELFAQRVRDRHERVLAVLEPGAIPAKVDAQGRAGSVRQLVRRELHDHIGESSLLGFEELAALGVKLQRMIAEWPEDLGDVVRRTTFGGWFTRMSAAARRMAHERTTEDPDRTVQRLRADLERFETGAVGSSPRRVLIFDDSEIARGAMTAELEVRGYEVVVASKQDEFSQLLGSFLPEVTLLDVNLPGARGDQLCQKLRANESTRSLPVVLVSSRSENELEGLASSCGATGYFSKQHGITELATYLDGLLAEVV